MAVTVAQVAVDARYRVLSLLCCVAAIAYIQRAAMGVPAGEIAHGLGSSDLARDMGYVQSAWYAGYALLQLPSGWLADRLGSRITVLILAALWSLLTMVAAGSTSIFVLASVWGLMGAAQAGVFPCATKAIGATFPQGERARASGMLAAGMTIGAAVAPMITSLALEALMPASQATGVERWRLLLVAYALPGFAWVLLFWFMVPNALLPVSPLGSAPDPVDWSRMFRSIDLLLLCAQQFFRAAAMVFFVTWFPVFLQEVRGVTALHSGMLATGAGIGGVLGSLLGGFASDWLLARTGNRRLSRQGIACAGMASCSILILLSHLIADTTLSTMVIGLGAFCATFGGVSGYTVAIDLGGRHVATVFSTMNMCGNIGAALFPVTAGWLVSYTGNWNVIIFLFAAVMAVDAVCWAILNPKAPLFGDNHDSC